MNNNFKIENLVFGCSGVIGKELIKKLNFKKTIFTSQTKIEKKYKWIKNNLDKPDFKQFPKQVNNIYFLASPYYLSKNIKNKKKITREIKWLKNIVKNIKCKKFIYLSSSSVYLNKHPVGDIKLKCENILKSKNNFTTQIWRPFNIIGKPNKNLSDHFHNLLLKKIIINKKKIIYFNGHRDDERGYSSAKNLVDNIIFKSKKDQSFIVNYGNKNTIKVKEILKIFFEIFKIKSKDFKIKFKGVNKNKNIINNKILSIYSNERSKNIIRRYYKSYKNEKNL